MNDNIKELQNEIEYLKKILKENGINYEEYENLGKDNVIVSDVNFDNISKNVSLKIVSKEDAILFYSYFKGRNDIYARRYISKEGKAGYSWPCNNFWKENCPKTKGNKVQCNKCNNKSPKKLIGNDIVDHLKGIRNDDKDIIGVYPLLSDNTCNFLVFDFDDHDLGH